MTQKHECTFAEEKEPSGRLITTPCLICGLPALSALEELKLQRADWRLERIELIDAGDHLARYVSDSLCAKDALKNWKFLVAEAKTEK